MTKDTHTASVIKLRTHKDGVYSTNASILAAQPPGLTNDVTYIQISIQLDLDVTNDGATITRFDMEVNLGGKTNKFFTFIASYDRKSTYRPTLPNLCNNLKVEILRSKK